MLRTKLPKYRTSRDIATAIFLANAEFVLSFSDKSMNT
jgi:hypothetical protein